MSTFFMKWRQNKTSENMFFNDILVKNEILRPVWRAGNSMSEETDENISLPIICQKLDRWVGSESEDWSQRLSLRTSAILIDGAAKLYKKKMQQLIEDLAKLDEDMIFRNRRDATDFEDDTSISTSRSHDSPEQMMRRAEIHPDISFEAPATNLSISPPTLNRDHSFKASTPSPSKRQWEEIIVPPTLRREHSFITSTPSPFKKMRNSLSFHITASPKRLSTNSDQSKETTPYPWSKRSVSDHTETSLDSDDEKSSVSSTESSNDSRLESQDRVQRSTDSRNLAPDTDQSLRKRAQKSCDSQNQTSDQPTVKNTVQETERNSKISSNLETLKSLTQDTDKRSQSRQTFTEIFDIVAAKTDSQIDIKNTSDSETDSSDIRAAIEKSSDQRTAIDSDQGSEVSNRSIILKTTKKSQPKLQRKKKRPKPIKKFKDQATQVGFFHLRMAERDNDTLNERLPFAYLLIHDSYNSRFPSKIVISSLNEEINNLVCL